MLNLLILLSLTISSVYGASCADGTFNVAYSSGMCTKSGNQYRIQCQSKNNNCGSRLDSKKKLGKGTYQVQMKAAPGTGMNTAFYLYTYGRHNDQSRPWNEIDFELLAKNPWRIWTNVWTGHGTQHGKFVSLGFDATKGFHTYRIKIDGTNIKWIIDGKTKRTFKYTGYSDLKSTINNKNFQGELSLWGATNNNWPDMGQVWDNNLRYPLYAYFKGVSLSTSSFTEEEETASNGLHWAEIFAIIIGITLFCCVLIGGGIWYYKKRKSAGDVSFNHGDNKKETELGTTNTSGGDTPMVDDGENGTPVSTDGYDMSPVTSQQPEEQVQEEEVIEVEVETQA